MIISKIARDPVQDRFAFCPHRPVRLVRANELHAEVDANFRHGGCHTGSSVVMRGATVSLTVRPTMNLLRTNRPFVPRGALRTQFARWYSALAERYPKAKLPPAIGSHDHSLNPKDINAIPTSQSEPPTSKSFILSSSLRSSWFLCGECTGPG